MRESIVIKRGKKKVKPISKTFERKVNSFWERVKRFHKPVKKKEDDTLEKKVKEKNKKAIDDAIKKVGEKTKTEKGFSTAYQNFRRFTSFTYGQSDAFEEGLYDSKVDYNQLYSHLGQKNNSGYQLEVGHAVVSEKGETTHEEAEQIVRRIQYQVMMKSMEKLDIKEKERFSYWQEFNKVMLMFYHKTSPIRTDEVNYGAVNQSLTM
ncbi:hypothetical protein ACFLZB_02590 [Nanoarchaeota archaeon]